MTARYIIGDVFDVLATLPDDSVDLVFSSPPFLALRSYLPADHPDKGKEIGSEATPADFLDTLLDVVEACSRVLAPHGSLCFELGDTFASHDASPGGVNPAYGEDRFTERAEGSAYGPRTGAGWPLQKSLCGIPTLFAWSLAYGRNLLRPERETERWRIRNLVVWARPNPPVGALGDKFRPATSYLTVATKSRTRYFDLDAVREPHVNDRPQETNGQKNAGKLEGQGHGFDKRTVHPAGAPPLDYWQIPTAPYKGSHYATFPPELVVKPVKAMCPLRVCRICGEPSRRIVECANTATAAADRYDEKERRANTADTNAWMRATGETSTRNITLGWTDCGHNNWRTGLVLDCFAGSGTTLAVATGHGRDAIGIDLDSRNADLALERVGPLMMTLETLTAEGAA